MTIDSEDRPIQIVCSLLSFYGQCYIQNKKRVEPSNIIDLFYWDHLYLSGFQSQPLLSWAEMDEIILISTVFMPSVVVLLFLSLLSLAIMFTCHCILLFVGRHNITRSSVLYYCCSLTVTDNQMLPTLKDHYWPLFLPPVVACSCCEHTEYWPCIKCCTVVLFEMSYIYSLSIPKIT